jgi:hypothetical protein
MGVYSAGLVVLLGQKQQLWQQVCASWMNCRCKERPVAYVLKATSLLAKLYNLAQRSYG